MEKKVGAGVSYTAASLEDVAKMFDSLAKREFDQAVAHETQKQKRWCLGAEAAYKDAASILRATKFSHSLEVDCIANDCLNEQIMWVDSAFPLRQARILARAVQGTPKKGET